ncbi:MAG: helix-turn-helix domain-containing protein [Phycisphaeraceae bacterium]|nr:helix-turn-helix domain-containing protein [Phycisphaeraceae bacterium]
MAKMFYSIEETAAKLGMSTGEVQQLAASGKLQEFRDRDKLVFKVEQVDLLAHGSEHIPLADSKGGSGLELALEDSSGLSGFGSPAGSGSQPGSGSGMEIDDGGKERSGISIFDTESTEEGDPSAVTRITPAAGGGDALTLESVGSGSGLLDLTREGDDTSLGADLLEDVYKSDEDAGGSQTTGASGLFEPTAAASDVSPGVGGGVPALAMVAMEPYDGTGSGIAGGAAFAGLVIAAATMFATIAGIIGAQDNPIVSMVAGNPMMWLGIGAGVLVLSIVVGLLIGRKTG